MPDITPIPPCTPNLNGTNIDDLARQAWDNAVALRTALGTLQRNAPHGRDYQLSPYTYAKARDWHEVACATLDGLANSYTAEAERLVELSLAQHERRTPTGA